MPHVKDWPGWALAGVAAIPVVLFLIVAGVFVSVGVRADLPDSWAVYAPLAGLLLVGGALGLLWLAGASRREMVLGTSLALFCVDMLGLFFAIGMVSGY
jgi:hypothetical protein